MQWNPGLVAYWEQFGGRIGTPAPPFSAPAHVSGVVARAVRVRPDVVRAVEPMDLDIVLERPSVPGDDARFDLVIATNILIYYDTLEQSLALRNITEMMRPGGWLLTNEGIVKVPALRLEPAGYIDLSYSDERNSSERVSWFRKPR